MTGQIHKKNMLKDIELDSTRGAQKVTKLGFVVYRTTYADEEKWSRFIELFQEGVRKPCDFPFRRF